MDKILGIFEAKARFSELMRFVQSGAEFIVTNRGKQVAKIIPLEDKFTEEELIMQAQNLAKEIGIKTFDWENEFKLYRDESRG